MHLVTKFNGPRIGRVAQAHCREIGMSVVEGCDVRREVSMALGAGRSARRGQSKCTLMLDVARGARRRKTLFRLVDGSVMAGQARRLRDPCSKARRHMARRTIVGEDGVAFRQRSGVERTLLSGEARPSEPRYAEPGGDDRQQALPARDGIHPLEVVQVDALRELLGGSGSTRHINT